MKTPITIFDLYLHVLYGKFAVAHRLPIVQA